MKSMTGFGEGRVQTPAGTARVAVSAVNHKGASVQVRCEPRDAALEERLREQVRAALGRGSASVHATWEPAVAAGLDPERLAAAWRELAALATRLGAPPPTLGDALAVAGRGQDGGTGAQAPVLAALAQALAGLDAARAREGEALRQALGALATRLRETVARMHPLAAARLPRLRERLAAQVAAAVGAAVPPEVLAREIALEASRIDIAEELTRLDAHLAALDRLLARRDPVGRELEFLAQELGREANTAGAKANDAALSALAIELKVAVDQVREQAANVL